MSETAQNRPSDSLLYSDQLFQVLGGDAMQILRCGICMEFFDVPIVLPCGHTFCLHCLTEMCKHASRNCILSPLKDLRIGCPNCRVLIYASPILERNVTCNFIIQSLIECLRARDGRKRRSIGVNTDEVHVGSRIRSVSDLELNRVIKEVDRMTEALGKRNVVDNAYFEIDEIRRQYLAQQLAHRHEEEDLLLQQKTWNQSQSIRPYQLQQVRQQQPFYHQQQQQQQQVPQKCPRSFSWEDFNNQMKTASSPHHHQQPSQNVSLKQHFKFQQTQKLAQTSQYQLRLQPHGQPQLQPHNQSQPQLQQDHSSVTKMPSKMATVLPLQRCSDVGQFPNSVGQFDLTPGHPSGLDNDPAIMSYSYKAAINPMTNK